MTAFVQCPACGGPVHPVAGRCKHCKADLVAHREAEARARRAAQQAMHETARSAPPPPPGNPRAPSPAPAAAPAPHPRAQTPQPSLQPQVVYAEPSAWSRRWPLLVSAVALLAILVSLFFLLHTSSGEAEPLDHQTLTNAPHVVPDQMPSPTLPQPQMPSVPDPDFAPQPLDPGGSTAPRAWTTAPDPGTFSVALVETVCAKLTDCGISDDFSSVLCKEMAKGASNPALDAKVKSGECTYDRAAASACLKAVSNMSCDMNDADDVAAWLGQASSMVDCAGAFTCR